MAREFSKQFYHSKEWQSVRDAVLKRDAYLCIHCGSPAEEVHHVTHLTPDNIWDTSITLNMDNLISLCRSCHFNEHKRDKSAGFKRYNDSRCVLDSYTFDSEGNIVPSGGPNSNT